MFERPFGGCRRAAICLLALAAAGCAAQDAYVADAGLKAIPGLDRTALRMCAGLPARVSRDDDTEIWSYELDGKQAGGVSVSVPVFIPPAGGALNVGVGGGYCRMLVRFEKGRVTEAKFSGDTGSGPARDSVCAPVVRACIGYRQPTP
jgi:hypothetical protein